MKDLSSEQIMNRELLKEAIRSACEDSQVLLLRLIKDYLLGEFRESGSVDLNYLIAFIDNLSERLTEKKGG